MRPLLALIVVVVSLGSVALYRVFVDSLPPVDFQLSPAQGEFVVDITLTFDAVDNSFTTTPTTLKVKFEKSVFHTSEPIRAGIPFVIPIENVKQGLNEFNVEVVVPDINLQGAAPTTDAFSLDPDKEDASEEVYIPERAVRIRMRRNGQTIAETTKWSPPGGNFSEQILVDVPPQDQIPNEPRSDSK